MENKQKGIFALVLAGSTVFVIGLFAAVCWNARIIQNNADRMVAQSLESQQTPVDEDSLENYYFCADTYKVNSISLDGIDVVGRISEIAFQNLEKQICGDILNIPDRKILRAEIKQYPEDADYKPTDYYLYIEQTEFKIDTKENKIYLVRAVDGELVLIGHLKLVVSEPAANWKKTCKNIAAGYQVQYPDEWSTIVGNDMSGFSAVDACDAAKKFGTNVNNVLFAPYDEATKNSVLRRGIWITAVPNTVKHDFADPTDRMEMLVDGEELIWKKDDRVGGRLLHHGTTEYRVVISEDVPEELVTEFFSTFKFLK